MVKHRALMESIFGHGSRWQHRRIGERLLAFRDVCVTEPQESCACITGAI